METQIKNIHKVALKHSYLRLFNNHIVVWLTGAYGQEKRGIKQKGKLFF